MAAPTAGLHFTDPVLDQLAARGVRTTRLTLHVSAGTFRPVTVECVSDHDMHNEHFAFDVKALRDIVASAASGRPLIPVGTTSARVSESVYWLGVRHILKQQGKSSTGGASLRKQGKSAQGGVAQGDANDTDNDNGVVAQDRGELRRRRRLQGGGEGGMVLGQWDAYALADEARRVGGGLPTLGQAYGALISAAEASGLDQVTGSTSLCIVPGYVRWMWMYVVGYLGLSVVFCLLSGGSLSHAHTHTHAYT